MKYLSLFGAAVLLTACSIYETVEVAKETFYSHNYHSNLDTRKTPSWRPSPPRKSVKRPPTRKENWANYKVGKPYQIDGRWYHPKEDPDYSEVGMASWYGSKFHNKQTANGEIFDKNGLTAAHRTLPLPSVVRVTNLKNGRSMKLRVNDRGPFAKNRIIDLSEYAATQLGFKEDGLAWVKVEFDKQETANLFYDPQKPDMRPAPVQRVARHLTSPRHKTYKDRNKIFEEHFVQTGAYRTSDNAHSIAEGLKKVGPVRIEEASFRRGTVYRVKLGPFRNEEEAGRKLDEVAMMGFHDAIIVGE